MLNNTLEKWKEKTVKDVTEICLGLTHTPKYVENGVPFLSVKDISSGFIDFSNTKFISREEFESLPNGAKPKKGDVLFARVGTLGCPSIVDTDKEFGTFVSLGYFRPNTSTVLNTYLRYWMLSPLFWQQVKQNVQGSTLKNLNTGWLKDFKIPIPSLSAQQRIVGILDEAFENIEKAKQNTLQNLNNAKELFESALEDLFTKNADEWTEKKLSEIGKIYTGTTPKTTEKDNFGNFIPFIKPADFKKDGTLNYNNEGLSEKGLKNARFIPKNSVLMVCIGATITKTSYTTADITCNQQINTLTPNLDNYKFIYYAMIRKSFKDVILSGCPQTTLPIINKTNWSELTIKLPDTRTQQKIVSQLDELQEQTKKLEQIYTQKLQDLDELKQSILQKAFNGEL